MSRPKTVALWSASGLLAVLFAVAGLPKIPGGPGPVEQFAQWGYPAWFPMVIGCAETLGAIALLIPRVARLGALLLMVVMLGAAFTHVRAAEWARLPFVLGLAVVLFLVFRARGASRPSAAGEQDGVR